jgi:membrane-bound ClpP family serine protease
MLLLHTLCEKYMDYMMNWKALGKAIIGTFLFILATSLLLFLSINYESFLLICIGLVFIILVMYGLYEFYNED